MSSELQCFQLGFVLRRTVRAVRINVPAGVGFVQNILENPAVMNRSIGTLVLPDELVLDVHLDMILVAEVVFAPFLRPACIRIFLAFLRFAPVLDGRFSLLDRLVFLPRVALNRYPDDRRVHNLPLASLKTRTCQKLAELAVTADVEEQKNFAEHGFTGVLLKPLTIDTLSEFFKE